MTRPRISRAIGLTVATFLATSCVTGPAPIVIYQDELHSVSLRFDPEAGTGHSHPASLTPEQIVRVLRGVWVRHRDVVGGFGLFADKEGAPAFSATQILRVAPYLSEGLQKASPKDMVTFYLISGDPSRGKLVTSGGLFVRKDRLYFILANANTSPSSVQYENNYEIDTRDQPLLPIARYKFTAGFRPQEAWIPNAKVRGAEGYERYMDESKLLVIDLPRVRAETPSPKSPSSSPAGQPTSPSRP